MTEKRGCDYCRDCGVKPLADSVYISAEIEEDKLLLYEKENCTSKSVRIRFCPMCGRKLNR